jgi:hypothetical protein
MPASELYPPVVDAPTRAAVFAIFADATPTRSMDMLWARLKVTTRLVWCHAACLYPDKCLLEWPALSRSDQTALYCALANMIDFFDEAGA